MNKYGQAALEAVEIYKSGKVDSPKLAWEEATSKIFGKGTSSQVKGCPRDTFLGLCEEGLVKGIPKGNYTRSKKNKAYAFRAVTLLRTNPVFKDDSQGLWGAILNGEQKVHNSQMDVVTALWKKGVIL
jgi:hypothetical protein